MSKKNLEQWLAYIDTLHDQVIEFGLDRAGVVASRLGLIQPKSPETPNHFTGRPFKKTPRATVNSAKDDALTPPVTATLVAQASEDPDQAIVTAMETGHWQSHLAAKVITVTGTNGKGSCVALLEAMLIGAGYRVASYTSPHIHQFNDRIKFNGQPIDNKLFCSMCEQVESARGAIALTWYEFTTLAALLAMQEVGSDILILEVGCGGRLDTVNLIQPDLAIVTNVSLDHCEWLGDTVEEIGYQKAGIFRHQVPVIFGSGDMPHSLEQVAMSLSAPIIRATFSSTAQSWSLVSEKGPDHELNQLPNPHLPVVSAACALYAIRELGLNVGLATIHQALQQTRLIGRWQQLPNRCELIVDVAHNPAATEQAAMRLRAEVRKGKTYAICGMMADKEIEASLRPLCQVVNEWHVVDLATPRAEKASKIREIINAMTPEKCYDYAAFAEAMAVLELKITEDDRIFVFGSFYTVAAALSYSAETASIT